MTTVADADLMWGINGHPIVSYPGVTIGQQLDYLEDLGMTSYRVDISHANEAPKLAELVKAAKVRGIDILPVITPGNINLKSDDKQQLYDKAHALAVELGSQFRNDIRVWELGNEMENFAIIKPCEMRDDGSQYPCEWGDADGGGALDYYGPRWVKVSAVLKGLSDGMKSVDPGIRKAMGTAGWGHLGAFERMQRDGIEWDISVWHMYVRNPRPEPAFKVLARFGRPIWVTEFNNPHGSQKGDQEQAEGLRTAMMRLRALQKTYNIEAAHIYELLDETYWAPDFEAFMGLVGLVRKPGGGWRTGEPKPAYFAVRDAIRGARHAPPGPNRSCNPAKIGKARTEPLLQAAFAYCLILGRSGDSDSLDHWAAVIESEELSRAEVIMALMDSDEFRRLYAVHRLTDREYVRFLYRLLLGREADGGGLDAYVRDLAKGTMTREKVAPGIIASHEFQNRYRASLSRGINHQSD